jgi:hypothetical protein
MDAATNQELWDSYGLIGDIMVRMFLSGTMASELTSSKPFTTTFPRADIHEILSPDLLHQIIKGTFKDHLVDWVVDYINMVHPAAEASRILTDIDRRYVCPLLP